MTDLDRLEAIAKAAAEAPRETFRLTVQDERIADYIRELRPPLVLALIAVARAAQAIDEASPFSTWKADMARLTAALAALQEAAKP